MPEYLMRGPGHQAEVFAAANATEAYAHAAGCPLYVRVEDPDDTVTQDEGRVDWTAFSVTVEPLTDGWRVKVSAVDDPGAEITSSELDTALAMAVPYMRVLASPDPFVQWLRSPAAPDGPPEVDPDAS